ncbi:hypothetical protein, partial [Shewanella litoralis]|uniref:hypothetical protein n=1 Tax=Shewanella litoralis TaxID=2282700 RepID=UPI00197D6C43
SEVKHSIADGSVGSPHVRVGHFQTPNKYESPLLTQRAFLRLKFEFCASTFIYQNEQDSSVVDMPM